VERILKKSRNKGFTIIHVKSEFQPDRSDWMLFYKPERKKEIPCIKDKYGADFTEFSRPLADEYIIKKQTFDAFVNPKLIEYLKSKNIKAALIAGIQTSVCVLFTATSAYLRKIIPFVIEDACADNIERHKNSLQMYKHLCFKTVTTEQVQTNFPSIMKTINQFSN